MEETAYPMVSCICVAEATPDSLKQSIHCFLGQTYDNKELIIVYDSENKELQKTIEAFENPHIVAIASGNIGEDKKIENAVSMARGTYICLWSSDDWHHVARLEYQYQTLAIKGFPACVLHYLLLGINGEPDLYISQKRLWFDTLFIKKDSLMEKEKGTPFIHFVQRLDSMEQLYYINDVPNLYMYMHSKNRLVRGKDSWQEILVHSYKSMPEDASAIYKLLQDQGSELEEKSIAIDAILGNTMFEEEDNTSNKDNKIPKIIHLTYKTKDIPEMYRLTYESIQALHPHWEIRFYTDEEAKKLVEDYFPELLEIYEAYPSHIQRVDVFRILIVYLFGGFYLDLDMYCFKSLDELCSSVLVLGEEIRYSSVERKLLNFELDCEIQIANYMFGSTPGHPFWIELLMEMVERSDHIVKGEIDVLKSTGPGVLSEVYEQSKHKYQEIMVLTNKFKRCHSGCPTVTCHFGDFAAHRHVNGWTWTGKSGKNVTHPKNSNIIDEGIKQKAQTILGRRLNTMKKEDLRYSAMNHKSANNEETL